MSRRKSLLFNIIICAFIASMVFLSAVLNAYSFINSSVDAVGENRAIILNRIKGSLEYGLKYGKQLDNYYGIESLLVNVQNSCESEYVYIRNAEGNLLYGEDPGDYYEDSLEGNEDEEESSENRIWTKDGMVHITQPISDASGICGYIGIGCKTDAMKAFSRPYVRKMYDYAFYEVLAGIVLFNILYHVVHHKFEEKKLKIIILTSIILVSLVSIIPTYNILSISYRALSEDVAKSLVEQSAGDLEGLIDSGVYYSDISEADDYYNSIASSIDQVSAIRLTDVADQKGIVQELPADGEGRVMRLEADISDEYVFSKIKKAIINSFITTITAIMISIEILMFLIGLLIGKKRNRRALYDNSQARTIEEFGIVRGLSFFFASFRFMSVAFMSIVLVQIYTPVYVWGKAIPYEILLSLPMAGQVFVSMITSYMSGIIIHNIGWKKTTLMGILFMMLGTTASSFASAPVPFILAQMLVGTGLGFAKMGVDIYAVAVASEEDMSRYTAGSNAGIIVGYSCSAALGALIASIFGYQGAYIVMTIIGAGVFILILLFGMNVAPREEDEEEAAGQEDAQNVRADFRFPAYILFIIIPYFFIMMFVDYFFPVYANGVGITTDNIGYVMLVYGIVTAYVGTPLCPVVTKFAKAKVIMPVILLILAGGLFIFSMKNFVLVAAIIVALIGLVDGIMPSVQFMYVYDLPFAKKIGFSRALGIEGFFSSMIGAAAPVIFGVVMMYGNGGLAVVAILIAVCAVLFLLVNGVIKGKGTIAGVVILSTVCLLLSGREVYARGDSKLRIGYSQAGSYYEFDYEIYQIGAALIENGEITSKVYDSLNQGDDARTVWKALCEADSDKYEFVEEAFIDTTVPGTDAKSIVDAYDIDMMITMGTSAGLEIKNNTEVPYINLIASDPVSSNITGGVEYSGNSREWAHVDPDFEMRALSVMDDIFAPHKVGIVYNKEDPEAYIYSGAKSLDELAAATGKEVVAEYVVDEFDDTDEAYENYKKELKEAHEKLAGSGIDLFVLTTTYLELEDYGEVLEPFIEKGIPVFSVNSTEDVRCGALAAVEMIDYENVGRFAADTLSKYESGTDLKDLTQLYSTAPYLVLNVDTMRRCNIKMSIDTLISASKIYNKYEGGK